MHAAADQTDQADQRSDPCGTDQIHVLQITPTCHASTCDTWQGCPASHASICLLTWQSQLQQSLAQLTC